MKTSYIIDGRKVSKSVFEKAKAELTITGSSPTTNTIRARNADTERGQPDAFEEGKQTWHDAVNKKTGKKCKYIEYEWPSEKVFFITGPR